MNVHNDGLEKAYLVNAIMDWEQWPDNETARTKFNALDSEQKHEILNAVRLEYRRLMLDDVAFVPPPPHTLQHRMMELAL